MYYVYILRCDDNSLYTGITSDIKRRMNEHFTEINNCAKYTKSHKAKKIEAYWNTDDKKNASKLEYHIKKLSKIKKEELIKTNNLDYLLGERIEVNKYNRLY